jgi:hypothetical protein
MTILQGVRELLAIQSTSETIPKGLACETRLVSGDGVAKKQQQEKEK